jgi:hypothetical protein
MTVCTQDDEYVRERPRWTVELSNGDVVYQDDDRPGVEPASAWLRLRSHLAATGLRIRAMWLQFRSNRVRVGPEYADGYFFANMAFGVLQFNGRQEWRRGFVVGVYSEPHGELWAYTFKVPELALLCHPERRDLDPADEKFIDNRPKVRDGDI